MSTRSLTNVERQMKPQLSALYDLAQEIGKADFLVALELAAEQQMYGAEYLRAIVTLPSVSTPQVTSDSLDFSGPSQAEVERDLAQYERSVANRDSVRQKEPMLQGGRA